MAKARGVGGRTNSNWHYSNETSPFCLVLLKITNELAHDKINRMACALSEDSDQSGHPLSLIRVCPHGEFLV